MSLKRLCVPFFLSLTNNANALRALTTFLLKCTSPPHYMYAMATKGGSVDCVDNRVLIGHTMHVYMVRLIGSIRGTFIWYCNSQLPSICKVFVRIRFVSKQGKYV
jgi:hypothetical protein